MKSEAPFKRPSLKEALDAWKKLLAERGYVNTLEVDFKRYVGAQIGIYNPDGEKVGRVSHLRNKEVLFVVGPHRGRVARAFDAISPGPGAPEPSAAGSC